MRMPQTNDDHDDDGFSSNWSATEDEGRRIKEYEEYNLTGEACVRFLQYDWGEAPGVVLVVFFWEIIERDQTRFTPTIEHR